MGGRRCVWVVGGEFTSALDRTADRFIRSTSTNSRSSYVSYQHVDTGQSQGRGAATVACWKLFRLGASISAHERPGDHRYRETLNGSKHTPSLNSIQD